ncbi:ABC transporter substrate-binding protein [Propionivibrio dicarboxylicus]|uniref:Branched-chain amino acid transport system substrate-binding protein n=1 Tax=Propionivibrio dicarboxylicus TaxID=83767 RepID=A0A1G8DT19_9RHOO|nr:ABC transporter substrate-binding protein [Propionivibrio dicarboxylicus]SDH60844.1 branched-chain amino acid transport system substrate-binding protein [Propionivibrio dicarboxylicus]
MIRCLITLLTIFCALLTGCGPQEPIRIGFIGGLSDRNSDNGQSGLNGVTLAIENFNRAGGANGRLVELIARDDAQNAETAAKSANELVGAGVEAIIGPFTSGMAEVIIPITGKAGIFEISPTITSMAFYGKDDNLFRINRTTRDNAVDYAAVMARRGLVNIAIAYDIRNRNFSESWLKEFREALATHRGIIAAAIPYESAADSDFDSIVRDLLKSRPDSLFFISGAIDVARLAKAARSQAPKLPIGASEWASTEQLIDLGGEFVEGLLIVQNYDRDDRSQRFTEFSEAYLKRFQRAPGYSSVSAHDAATVLLTALKQRQKNETIKAAALRSGPYQGLQQEIVFDQNGDTQRKVYFTQIRSGRYVKIE